MRSIRTKKAKIDDEIPRIRRCRKCKSQLDNSSNAADHIACLVEDAQVVDHAQSIYTVTRQSGRFRCPTCKMGYVNADVFKV
jgi:hypothetical protein